jgi:flagellar basal-body rod modification protein FlgD
MTVSSVFSSVNSTASATKTATDNKTGQCFGAMGATDFLKLLTVQMQQQDPTDPVDNKDMLAQMAQFSSLSNSAEMNSTLKAIATKLGVTPDSATTDTSSTDGVAA